MAETFNTPYGDIDPAAVKAAVAAAAETDDRRNVEEITIKFAKGLVSEPFVSKEGKELVRIQIPNADPEDHSPWQEFVLGTKQVHENQYGKGLWAKIPADGHTTVSRPFLAGQDENGKNRWDSERRSVPNRELKEMVEFYKTRGRDEKSAPQKDKAGQEKAGREGKGSPQKAEAEQEAPGDKDHGEKISMKEQIASGKKEAVKATIAKETTPKKQHTEPER